LFARVSMDDCIEANVSTFASEMRETAFILRYAPINASTTRFTNICLGILGRIALL
jgi:DNA mismatch repair protein MSH4